MYIKKRKGFSFLIWKSDDHFQFKFLKKHPESINTNTYFIPSHSEGGGSWGNFYVCFLPSAEFRISWIRDFIYSPVLMQKGVTRVKGYGSNKLSTEGASGLQGGVSGQDQV